MQVEELMNEGLKRSYKMTLSSQELDDKVMAKLKEAQPNIEMKGFRKGKVHLPLMKKQYGDRVLGLADGGMPLDARAESLRAQDLRGLYG